MKGCNFKFVTRNPLNAPATTPINNPTTIARIGGTPLTQHIATAIPVMAKVHPMDKSIPAVMIVNIIPAANTPFNTIFWNTVKILFQDKKFGFIAVKIIPITIVARNTTISRLYLSKICFILFTSNRIIQNFICIEFLSVC